MFSKNQPEDGANLNSGLPLINPIERARELLDEADRSFASLLPDVGLRAIQRAVDTVDRSLAPTVFHRTWVRKEAAAILAYFEQPLEAEEFLAQAVQFVAGGSRSAPEEVAPLQIWRGELLCRAGRLEEAHTSIQLALDTIGLDGRNSPLEMRGRIALANVYLARGDCAKHGMLMSAVFSDVRFADPSTRLELAEVLESVARDHAEGGDFQNALFLAQEALSILKEAPSVPESGHRMLRAFVGRTMHSLRKFEGARDIGAAVLREILSDPSLSAGGLEATRASRELADTLLELNEFERAETLLTQALSRAKEAGEPRAVSMCVDALSVQYLSRGMDEEGKKLRESADEMARQLPLGPQLLSEAEGSVLEQAYRGEEEAALERLEQLVAEAKNLLEGERRFVEPCLLLLKGLILVTSSPDEAREILDKVFEQTMLLPDSLQESLRMRAFLVEFQLALHEGDLERAVEVAKEQLRTIGKLGGAGSSALRIRVLTNLATAQSGAGMDDEAVKSAREAVALHEQSKDTRSRMFAHSLMLLARLLPDGDPEVGELFERARPILERYGD